MIMRYLFLTMIVSFNTILFGASEPIHHEVNWLDSWIIPNPGIFLWTIVTFLIVLIILKAKAWAPLIATLDKRESDIRESLDAAEKAREEAEKVSQDYEEKVQKAQHEAQQIVAEGKAAGERMKADIEASAKANADEMIVKAKEQIDAERTKAIQDIQSVVVDISLSAASKIIERNLDSSDNRKLVDDTIEGIGKA